MAKLKIENARFEIRCVTVTKKYATQTKRRYLADGWRQLDYRTLRDGNIQLTFQRRDVAKIEVTP